MVKMIVSFVLCFALIQPAHADCWVSYGGLSVRQFKSQSDSLSKEVQRQLDKFKNPNDPFWPKKASASVDVTGQNVAVRNYVTCLYESSSWYTASIVNVGGRDWLIVKGE